MSKPRTELEQPTELWDFSASRLGVISRCGLAFDYQYIKKLPAPWDRAATLFGTVVHDGVEEWYGPDEAPNDHQARDLAPIILAQWPEHLPPVIWKKVLELREMDEECKSVAAAIQFKRPQLKAPASTKEYLEAKPVKEFNERRMEMVELCDILPDIKWNKTEDPYKAYVKSAEIGAWMQRRWQSLPRPVVVERPFAIEVAGFRVRGRIDQVRVDPDAQGEVAAPTVDIKTVQQPLSNMEAFLQSFLYFKGRNSFDDVPYSEDVEFYLARKDKVQRGRIDPRRHEALASRILNGRARQIVMGQFEPSYGFWCDRCDFSDLCSSEIALWKGDGIVVEGPA